MERQVVGIAHSDNSRKENKNKKFVERIVEKNVLTLLCWNLSKERTPCDR